MVASFRLAKGPDFFPKPGSRGGPCPLNGLSGDLQDLRHLFERQAAEEPQFHDFSCPGVQLCQIFEGIIEPKDFLRLMIRQPFGDILQRHLQGIRAPRFKRLR